MRDDIVVEVVRTRAGYHHRVRDAGNHEILTSSEVMHNKNDCVKAAVDLYGITPILIDGEDG